MEFIQRIRKTDLARQIGQVIEEVQQGQMAVVESRGQPAVAIIDIVDYRLLRAVVHYYGQLPNPNKPESKRDLSTSESLPKKPEAHRLGPNIDVKAGL